MDIPTLTQGILELAKKGPGAPGEVPEADRLALVGACAKLRDAFENPLDKLFRINWAPYDTSALRLGVDMGLFETSIQKGVPLTVQEFAEPRNLDPVLVRRVLRLLAAISLFIETDVDTYVAVPMAAAYASEPLKSAITWLACSGTALLDLPDYFIQNGYKNPDDAFNGPWQFTHSKGESLFEWISKHPAYQEAFNKTMQTQKLIREQEWWDFFPVVEKLALKGEEKEKDRIVLADIGGGWGHDIKLFHDSFPTLQGKLVLEDQPSVVKTAKDLPPIITPVGHDFFAPHPSSVVNAKAYYLRTVLHDWPDKQATLILEQIKAAMAPDSLLLIHETVLPEQGVSYFDACLDFHMMIHLSSQERTEKEWRQLLGRVGFEVRQVWRADKESRSKLSLIEATVGGGVTV